MTTSSSWHLGMEGWQGALVSPCQVFCVKLLGTCRALQGFGCNFNCWFNFSNPISLCSCSFITFSSKWRWMVEISIICMKGRWLNGCFYHSDCIRKPDSNHIICNTEIGIYKYHSLYSSISDLFITWIDSCQCPLHEVPKSSVSLSGHRPGAS